MNDVPPDHSAFSQQLQDVILLAQDLVLAAQAMEARVNALSADAGATSLNDSVRLIRASAAQMAAMLLGLTARSERLAATPSLRPPGRTH